MNLLGTDEAPAHDEERDEDGGRNAAVVYQIESNTTSAMILGIITNVLRAGSSQGRIWVNNARKKCWWQILAQLVIVVGVGDAMTVARMNLRAEIDSRSARRRKNRQTDTKPNGRDPEKPYSFGSRWRVP